MDKTLDVLVDRLSVRGSLLAGLAVACFLSLYDWRIHCDGLGFLAVEHGALVFLALFVSPAAFYYSRRLRKLYQAPGAETLFLTPTTETDLADAVMRRALIPTLGIGLPFYVLNLVCIVWLIPSSWLECALWLPLVGCLTASTVYACLTRSPWLRAALTGSCLILAWGLLTFSVPLTLAALGVSGVSVTLARWTGRTSSSPTVRQPALLWTGSWQPLTRDPIARRETWRSAHHLGGRLRFWSWQACRLALLGAAVASWLYGDGPRSVLEAALVRWDILLLVWFGTMAVTYRTVLSGVQRDTTRAEVSVSTLTIRGYLAGWFQAVLPYRLMETVVVLGLVLTSSRSSHQITDAWLPLLLFAGAMVLGWATMVCMAVLEGATAASEQPFGGLGVILSAIIVAELLAMPVARLAFYDCFVDFVPVVAMAASVTTALYLCPLLRLALKTVGGADGALRLVAPSARSQPAQTADASMLT